MSPSPVFPVHPRPLRRRRFVSALVLAFLVLMVGVGGVGTRLRVDATRVARSRMLTGSADSAADLVFTPSGHLLFSSDWKGSICAWKMPEGRLFARMGARGRAVNALAISPDGAQLAAGDDGGVVQRWEIASGRQLPLLNVGDAVRQVAFSPDGAEIAVAAHGSDAVLCFDTRTGEGIKRCPARQEVTALAYTPDGKYLIAADEQEVRVWDRSRAEAVQTLKEQRVDTLVVSPDSTRLVLSGLYRATSVYAVATGKLGRTLPIAEGGSMAFLSDSRHLLVGYGSDLSVCDSTTGRVASSLTPPLLLGYTPTFLMRIFPYLRRYQRLPIQKVVVSPDGSTVAFGVQDTITLLPFVETPTQPLSAEPLPARR